MLDRIKICSLLTLISLFLSSAPLISAEKRTIYLVRHAEKQIDGTRDPDLTHKGVSRAKKLAEQLSKENITRIYSTNFRRTRNTAKPLTKLLDIKLDIYDPSNLEKFAKQLLSSNENSLVVGHSNTTPNLVTLLGGKSYGPIDEAVYDRLYEVSYDKSVINTILHEMKNTD